jgi:hypothetical protein
MVTSLPHIVPPTDAIPRLLSTFSGFIKSHRKNNRGGGEENSGNEHNRAENEKKINPEKRTRQKRTRGAKDRDEQNTKGGEKRKHRDKGNQRTTQR